MNCTEGVGRLHTTKQGMIAINVRLQSFKENTTEDSKEQLDAYQFTDLVQKPFKPETLYQRMARHYQVERVWIQKKEGKVSLEKQ